MTADILRNWRKYHREQLDQALGGSDGHIVRPIMDLLGELTAAKMPALLKLMHTCDWRLVDANTRFVVLHELNAAVTQLREREGKPPFDDALEDEPPTLGLIVRDLLFPHKRGNPPDNPA